MPAFGSLNRQLGWHSQANALRAGQPITRDADHLKPTICGVNGLPLARRGSSISPGVARRRLEVRPTWPSGGREQRRCSQ